jgi:uncharacterized Zn finger protein (UPF0148 family)
LQELQNRSDGIYGRIRWTATGKVAVDGGDYRFFSTEYDPNDLKVLNSGGGKQVRRVRPLRLDGLTLTNMNNNKGQKPITNRGLPAMPANGMCPDCNVKLKKGAEPGTMSCPDCGKNYADASASAGTTETNQKTKNKMSKVNTLLGLSADAEESSVIEAVTKLLNRGDITVADLTTLRSRSTTLETENAALLEEQVEGLLSERKVTDEKIINRLKPMLKPLKNRAERVACLDELGFDGEETVATEAATGKVLNRRDGKTPTGAAAGAQTEEARVQKQEAEIDDYRIKNRCSYEIARNQVRRTQPALFTPVKK